MPGGGGNATTRSRRCHVRSQAHSPDGRNPTDEVTLAAGASREGGSVQIEFDDRIRTGIDEIDEQHRQLVAIYNELDDAFQQGRANRQMSEILARLYRYTKVHFEHEERLLEECAWPDLAQHRFEHRQLAEKLRSFVVRYRRAGERISAEVVDFVRAWVVDHIMQCDLRYADHVKDHLEQRPTETAPTSD